MELITIEIKLIGSAKNEDVRKVMEKINKLVFNLSGYYVQHTKIKGPSDLKGFLSGFVIGMLTAAAIIFGIR